MMALGGVPDYRLLSARELDRRGLKDGRGYRVNDTVGLENVGRVLVPFLRNFRHDWNNPQDTKPRQQYNEQLRS
jgi:hypothetical protein